MHRALEKIIENYRLDSKNYVTFLVAALSEELIVQEYEEKDVAKILDGLFKTYIKVKSIMEQK